MDFLKKLKIAAGIQSSKKENNIEQDHLEIKTADTVDEIFAKTLLKNNGNFFYCSKKDDLIKTIKALVKKLNSNLIFCTEKILQELLNNAKINQNESRRKSIQSYI